jgi:hypothetical protein
MSTGSILESTYSPFHGRYVLFRLEELRELHGILLHFVFGLSFITLYISSISPWSSTAAQLTTGNIAGAESRAACVTLFTL